MKRYNTQNGSVHIMIVAVLVVALMAALGVVFYQNFVAPKPQPAPVVSLPIDTTRTLRTAFSNSIYALDYPKSWTAKTDKIEGSPAVGTATKLTNPGQTVQVTVNISDGELGSSCDTGDGLKVSYYKVYPTVVTKLADQSLYVVEALYDSAGGGYLYKVGLTPEGGDTHAAIGDSHCNIARVGEASSVLYGANKTLVHPTITAMITFPKLTKTTDIPLKEMQPAKDLFATSDYNAAVKILESARKE